MLSIKNISKKYITGDIEQIALDDVSFNLRDNEFVSVLGPSGSGKTTLLNIIGGLDRYDSGDLVINGKSTKDYKDRDWDTYRNHTIGFVFQSYNLIPHQSVLSNVELALTIGGVGPAEKSRRAKEALEEVGLKDHMNKKPNQLSGGQMQRVAIARALVNNPDILLADEPTGALDSETSVQIMDLLKKVAEKRLVVMVTHNKELAEEYSTRIVNLKDGKIVADSNPFDGAEEKPADISGKREKKAGMSFLTSLALSGKNLLSKKGRTILISLACSIGIIGIALILSISNGVNSYILDVQKEALSSYPITISQQAFDLTSLLTGETSELRDSLIEGMMNPGENDEGVVSADYSSVQVSEAVTGSLSENDLTAFKKYLDDETSEIHKYLGENGIAYTYDISFDVYTETEDGLLNTNADVNELLEEDIESEFGMMAAGISAFRSARGSYSGLTSDNSSFSELLSGRGDEAVSQVIKDSYDLVYGEWPTAYDEVVIVLENTGDLPSETLYQLGFLSADEYKAAVEKIENGEAPEEATYSYEELCSREFYFVPACDHYTKNMDGTYRYIDEETEADVLLENAVTLKVVGIICANEAATSTTISSAVGYTSLLTDYCITRENESSIIKEQEANPDINVLTGVEFAADADEAKIADVKNYLKNLEASEKASMYNMIMYYGLMGGNDSEEGGYNLSNLIGMVTGGGLDLGSLLGGGSSSSLLMAFLGAGSGEDVTVSESDLSDLMDSWLDGDPDEEILMMIYNDYIAGGTYEENLEAFGKVSYDAPVSISIYADTFEDKDGVTACIKEYNKAADEESRIVYTDYISLITSSITTIINAISYVLIAFVAVSLIVSCIMIGIITHISVMERTKEIGILRALGASKANISQVFNAETVIIGLVAGIIGVLIAALLNLPINAILKHVIGSGMINVNLPFVSAVILVVIAIAVTVIGGIIPAKKAAAKDPVIALRTE